VSDAADEPIDFCRPSRMTSAAALHSGYRATGFVIVALPW